MKKLEDIGFNFVSSLVSSLFSGAAQSPASITITLLTKPLVPFIWHILAVYNSVYMLISGLNITNNLKLIKSSTGIVQYRHITRPIRN